MAVRWRAGSSAIAAATSRSRSSRSACSLAPGAGSASLAGRFQSDPGRAPFAVEAEIDDNAREPSAEQSERLPARRVGPDPEHGFLRHVLGVGGIAENAAGEPEHGRQMPARKRAERPLVAARDPGHERFVAVIHRA